MGDHCLSRESTMNIYLILFASFSITCLALPNTEKILAEKVAVLEAQLERLAIEANNDACDDVDVTFPIDTKASPPRTAAITKQLNPCAAITAMRANKHDAVSTHRCVKEGKTSFRCVAPGDDEGADGVLTLLNLLTKVQDRVNAAG